MACESSRKHHGRTTMSASRDREVKVRVGAVSSLIGVCGTRPHTPKRHSPRPSDYASRSMDAKAFPAVNANWSL